MLPRTIVWVANRNNPIQNSTVILKLTHQGSLVILDGSRGVIWSSNSSRIESKSVVVKLLDSGNLVVKDANISSENGKVLWESFDYPGNTFLSGMKLRSNLLTGPYKYITSWRSPNDPADGDFSYRVDTHGFPQLIVAKGTKLLYRAGSWNGFLFTGFSRQTHGIYNLSFVVNDKEICYQYEIMSSSITSRMTLDSDGFQHNFLWLDMTENWKVTVTRPANRCDHYAFCGINSNCNINDSPICECLDGFVPKFQAKWNSSDWSGGCVRRTKLNCVNGDGFFKYANMKLPDTSSSWFDKRLSLEECKTVCLKNCSCIAYANLDARDGGSGCLLWFDVIVDMTKHVDQGQDIYIRLASSELDHIKNKRNLNMKKLVGTFGGVIAFILGLTALLLVSSTFRKKLGYIKKLILWNHKEEKKEDDLATIFDFSTVINATNNFSNKYKLGEGGFGPVYKGILAYGQEVAVKRLSKTSGQGTEEFKNEVKLMATLQHRNLVKLLGCSIQQDERLLIYEFMPNRSLDFFIFDSTRSKLLDWTKRLEIIDGIARGMLYLHQDSTLRIIHRDLKTSNILLDINMIPKISDFGLARSFMEDQAEANTNRVMGTYGYMPPEYAVHGSFSLKSDVFSFGVVVLEIISGKKNRGFCDPQNHLNLLGHAWRLWIEERSLELIADILYDESVSSEIIRFIHVGLLCVQHKPENRPTMSSVVFMLKGEKLLPKPSEPGFYAGRDNTISTGSSSKGCSVNEASISLLEAR
ncbi:G-type lectin S-receptor-like serine/threonine-protein kinase At4g27290 isoform X2 [Cicer arietinum]|nr:G-type lectin S-receptor-like serine/threonine-protein kinase At4g27290 isoform X2 [Cicer arietinum]XP_012571126.1 G-type lectin S-receptor-like serine/threonine-protein kinase At4g27290 isoform X2 [Cicer arietinum]XP_012571127.1 G-type lectin S-receptor-like serine/threonine-protein kinase At4g27290 isoform X2 [Cicer arietinum]XP_012571128.1 G-type lectin S-receptor-like serine/threonine-protein kinase At4g27290 isoform X2 [Cicer arietinum]